MFLETADGHLQNTLNVLPLTDGTGGAAQEIELRELRSKLPLRMPALGNVACDLGRPGGFATIISERGNGDGYLDRRAALADAHGLEVVDGFAMRDPAENVEFLIHPVWRNEHLQRFPDRLLRRIAE